MVVQLGHNQRHVVAHTERARIVNHHRAILGDGVSIFLGCAGSGRSESNVHTFKVIVVLKKFNFILFTAEGIFRACTAWRTKQNQFVDWKISLFEYAKELLSDSSARANNSYFHLICFVLVSKWVRFLLLLI